MTHKFRKIVKFKYKNQMIQLFKNEFDKIAFLEIDNNGNYRYPNLETLFELTALFANKRGIKEIEKRKIEYFSFVPKIKYAGVIIALSSFFLVGCSNYYSSSNDNYVSVNDYNNGEVGIDFNSSSSHGSVDPKDDNYDYRLEAYNGTGIPEEISQEVLDSYLKYLAPADDEFDYMFATDYQGPDMIGYSYARDSKCYEAVIGYRDATLEEIQLVINNNNNIPEKYKDFVYTFLCELKEKYPSLNLAIFKHNLSTLIIDEVTPAELSIETLSTSSAACYIGRENRICVLNDLDLSRESDDYIILTHELCHAGRSTSFENSEGGITQIDFRDTMYMGYYAEEAIITNLVTEMQGIEDRAVYYPILTNYYRIISECTGYTYEDFFNHGANYLIYKMDEFMGDEQYAYQIVAMIDAQMTLRYSPHIEVDFHEFQPVYEYLAEMYFKKYITSDMSYQEAEEIFNNFYYEITYGMETMNRKYTFNEDTFRPTFDSYLKEMGISNSLSR